MNFMRKCLALVLLVLLTGCASNLGEQTNSQTNENEKIKLNVHQADLIASITDNEKYLNKDLFHKLDVLEDDDNINVII